IRADPSGAAEHRDVELTVGRSAVAQRVVTARVERALTRDWSDPICRKDLRAQDFRRFIAHSTRRAVWEQVTETGVPRVAEPSVLDVEDEIPPLSQIHRRRA